jgi:hypothetical protein
MKKTSLIILSIATTALLFSCKKKESEPEEAALINTSMADGLPENYKSINGYLYSGVQTYQYSGSNVNYYSFSYVAFCDPTKNLVSSYNHYTNQKNFSSNIPFGNIDVGNVTLNGATVWKSSSNSELFYGGNFNSSTNFLNYNAVWTTEGNKTFKALGIYINKGHPIIQTSALGIPSSISKNSNFTINIGNNISNYDSLIVMFEDGNFIGKIRKVLAKNTTSVTFTTQEMSVLNTSSYARINICAYNYSNMTIDSKINVFELSNQYYINNIYLY